MEQLWVVDRFEGDLAVVELEDGRTLDLPRGLLPPDAAEGDVLRVAARGGEEGWRVEIRIDAAESRARRAAAAERLRRLRQRDPGGDLEL